MTKKIFRSFMLSAVAVLLAGVVIVMTCLYSYFASVQESQLQDQLQLAAAAVETEGTDYLNKLTKLDLLVIDDFGLMDLDLDKCRDLFEVLDTRDGRKSTVVISQFPVSTWFDMFADNTYADACLTRITDKHHTYRLEMNGINMRETE